MAKARERYGRSRRAGARLRALPAALRLAERNAAAIAAVEDTLDALGVLRGRHEPTFTPVERLHMFVDRLPGRLHGQVENNMVYYRVCSEAIVLLEGAPNSGNFRTRQAIEKLKAVTMRTGKAVAGGVDRPGLVLQ